MSDQFVAEIRIFAGKFAPSGWATCNGQTLRIDQNKALYSLLGTTYGGDGQSTFQLPNLQGRLPLHPGRGHNRGQSAGAEAVALLAGQMEPHTHNVNADRGLANSASPAGNVYKEGEATSVNPAALIAIYTSDAPRIALNPLTVGLAGKGAPHNNIMPTLVLNFCIAMQGIFPART